VIDSPTLALERPEMVVDLPAGGRRLMQKARGYVATVKAGQVHVPPRRGDGGTAGWLVRGPQGG